MQRTCLLLVSVVIALAALVGQTNAAALEVDNNADQLTHVEFGTALMMFYKAVQKIMPCGYAPLDLPVMAPFSMEYLPIDLNNEHYTVKGNISSMIVTGLNNFRFIEFSYDAQTQRTSYDLIFPEVQLLAEYMLNAWALFAGFPAQAAGQGLLNMKAVDLRLVGHFTLASSETSQNGLNVSDFDLHFYFGDMSTNNLNTLWDISANNFANRWVREFALMRTEQIQEQVDDIYAQFLVPFVDNLLTDVSMDELIAILVNESMDMNMIDCENA